MVGVKDAGGFATPVIGIHSFDGIDQIQSLGRIKHSTDIDGWNQVHGTLILQVRIEQVIGTGLFGYDDTVNLTQRDGKGIQVAPTFAPRN